MKFKYGMKSEVTIILIYIMLPTSILVLTYRLDYFQHLKGKTGRNPWAKHTELNRYRDETKSIEFEVFQIYDVKPPHECKDFIENNLIYSEQFVYVEPKYIRSLWYYQNMYFQLSKSKAPKRISK